MEDRTNLVDRFSTFIHWQGEGGCCWRSHQQLKRSMEKAIARNPDRLSIPAWVIFWHRGWQEANADLPPLARLHLYAYLQESCYRVAVELWSVYQQRLNYSIEDYFGLGILKFDKILTDFDPNLNPNLAAYGFTLLKWRIIDELRQVNKTLGHTAWSLLLHTSEGRLTKALTRSGITAASLDDYCNVWDCYKNIYQSSPIKQDGKLQEPSLAQWQQITNLYNQGNDPAQSTSQVRQWLLFSGTALFQYLSPPSISLNYQLYEDSEFLDRWVEEPENRQLESLELQAERQAEFQQIYSWLKQELADLDIKRHRLNADIQLILNLYYGQGWKQTSIAQQLGINQSTVARNLTKVHKILATLFIAWATRHLTRYPLQSHNLSSITAALEQWLQYHYQQNPMAQEQQP
jgi:RNA polymerase sigma factor (sigma-70 family)